MEASRSECNFRRTGRAPMVSNSIGPSWDPDPNWSTAQLPSAARPPTRLYPLALRPPGQSCAPGPAAPSTPASARVRIYLPPCLSHGPIWSMRSDGGHKCCRHAMQKARAEEIALCGTSWVRRLTHTQRPNVSLLRPHTTHSGTPEMRTGTSQTQQSLQLFAAEGSTFRLVSALFFPEI